MKITVLSENTAMLPYLGAEHGLSLLVETDQCTILFDTGQSDLFYENAQKLGKDLSCVDICVLSHGHYDHGGGIKKFLEVNKKAPVYVSSEAFGSYFSNNGYIGLDSSLQENSRIIKVSEIFKSSCFTIFPAGHLFEKYPVEHHGLEMEVCGKRVPDNFNHEQYLMLEENGHSVLISGCSHKGILSIAEFFKPDILFGGFHFMKIDPCDTRLIEYAKILLEHPTTYYTCHCTGTAQYEALKLIMKDKLHYASSGNVFEF